jgi:hypothetical protein
MIGTVLNFASANDEGVLRGEDGQRYRFSASDWCSAFRKSGFCETG